MSWFGMSSWTLVVPLLAAFLTGCSSAPPPLIPRESADNLGMILAAYTEAFQKLQRPPNSMSELKPFLQKLGAPDTVLVSPHDGQPYEIHWGVDPLESVSGSDPTVPQSPFIAYDRTGVDGIRYVATGMGVFRMSDQEFEQARKLAKKR